MMQINDISSLNFGNLYLSIKKGAILSDKQNEFRCLLAYNKNAILNGVKKHINALSKDGKDAYVVIKKDCSIDAEIRLKDNDKTTIAKRCILYPWNETLDATKATYINLCSFLKENARKIKKQM